MKLLAALRFLLELCTVAGAALAGTAVSWVLAVLFPLAVVAIWAALVAPKSARRLANPGRLVLEVVIFGGVGTALFVGGWPVLGAVLAGAAIAVAIAIRLLSAEDL
jgi:uncharacterized protein DUF2568